MYAVIESGGKQYRVELGSEIQVDRLDVEPGQHLDIARVLLVADGDTATIGRPVVEGATVSASVVRQMRGDKIVVFKYKPKARSRVKNGHRSELTVLRIADIAWAGRSAAKEQAAADAEHQKRAKAAQEAAAKQAAADQALAEQLAAAKAKAAAVTTEAARRTRSKAEPAETTSEAATEPAEAATEPAEAATEPAEAATEPAEAATSEASEPMGAATEPSAASDAATEPVTTDAVDDATLAVDPTGETGKDA